MKLTNKNSPSEAWISELSARYPCETEVDRFLVRKLRNRNGIEFAPQSLDRLMEGTRRLLEHSLNDPFEISSPGWLSGGASKLQMVFTLIQKKPDGDSTQKMVLRMEPAESNCESSRLREYEILKEIEHIIPVPNPVAYDLEGEYLPYPAIIYGFVSGVAKPSVSGDAVSGVGTFFPPALREPIGADFIGYLTKLHRYDFANADLSSYEQPESGTQALEWELNHWERVWESDANEDVPLMRLAMKWLRSNMPAVEQLSLVHGDYRTGNFLFDEEEKRITAILDWEMAYIGDRHADIAWATNRLLGHYAEDGETFLCGGFFSREEFIRRYERESGLTVDEKSLAYYDIFGSYKIIVICLATGYRVAINKRTHQDVLLAWLLGISYSMLEDLRQKLERVL